MMTILSRRAARTTAASLASLLLIQAIGGATFAQNHAGATAVTTSAASEQPGGSDSGESRVSNASGAGMVSPASGLYRDPAQGASSSDLVRRALASNGELAAARIDVERARARLRQAGLRPNPTLDFEQTTERLTSSGTDRATSIGVAVPLELGGKRARRVELARIELEAVETEVADR